MKLNEKLTELRKAKGLTQHEIAEALDVSRQAVSRWGVGTATPALDNLSSLSRLYGVPLDYFIQEEADEKVQETVPADVSAAVPVKSGRSCLFMLRITKRIVSLYHPTKDRLRGVLGIGDVFHQHNADLISSPSLLLGCRNSAVFRILMYPRVQQFYIYTHK